MSAPIPERWKMHYGQHGPIPLAQLKMDVAIEEIAELEARLVRARIDGMREAAEQVYNPEDFHRLMQRIKAAEESPAATEKQG